MFGWLIIAGTVVFGGLLALLGDKVGMKVGRKRLSLWGLRPKHTSRIITALTGVFIVGVTLLMLTLVSEYARTAIFRLSSIQKRLQSTTIQLNLVTERLKTTGAERDRAEEELKKTEIRYREAVVSLAEKQEELRLAEKHVYRLNRVQRELEAENLALLKKETALKEQVANLEAWSGDGKEKGKASKETPVLFAGEILADMVVTDVTVCAGDNGNLKIFQPLLGKAERLVHERGARFPEWNELLRMVDVPDGKPAPTKEAGVLRLVAENDTCADETVRVKLEVFPNRLLYKAGETIAMTEITARTPETECTNRLLGLLIQATNRAVADGNINDQDGSLTHPVGLTEILERLQQEESGRFRVELVATEDIYRVDPLKVDFRLLRFGG